VRHGFVATDKATGKTKGVGYVTYSLREDAEQAVAELDNKEFGAEGRKIRVSWANEKPSNLQRSTRPAPDASKIVQPGRSAAAAGAVAGAAGEAEGEQGGDPADPNAIRTLVLSGLPEVNSKVLWKKVRKVHDGIDLVFPVPGQDGVAHLVFPSHADAVRGLPKLQGHTYKGVVLTAVLKKQVDKLGAGGKGVSHAGRVIVRNLPWDVSVDCWRAERWL
jgi:nucleolar protein 4